MAVLAKDHVDAIRDELEHVFARPLVDVCIAHMVTAQESQVDLVKHGDTQAFEDLLQPRSTFALRRYLTAWIPNH